MSINIRASLLLEERKEMNINKFTLSMPFLRRDSSFQKKIHTSILHLMLFIFVVNET